MSDTSAVVMMFVISETIGNYSDKYSVPIRVFNTRWEADSFCEGKKRKVVMAETMAECIDCLMTEWDSAHIRPESPKYEEEGDDAEYNLHQTLRETEWERLAVLTGYDKVRKEVYGENHIDNRGYFITEVPVGR